MEMPQKSNKMSMTLYHATPKTFVLLLVLSLINLANSFQPSAPHGKVSNIHDDASKTRRRKMALAAAEFPAVIQESSAHKFSGAGPVQVDMNDYNLETIEAIAEEWTAVFQPATAMQEEGVYLRPRNTKEIMADTLKMSFPRKPDAGLGLELLELAGGREDNLGITIVSGLVERGCAENSGILPGDSIIKVEVIREKQEEGRDAVGLQENQESFAVSTECLGYDATVEAITSLPPVSHVDSEMFVLTVKRLRRKPKVKLNLQYPPDLGEENLTLELFSGENLRRAMLVRGVKLNDPLASRFDSGGTGDCGAEGTCATCAVAVIAGQDLLSPPATQEVQIFKKNPRWRMACKAVVGYGMKEGVLTVRVNPRQWDR
jgi:ferredoxin